MNLRKIQCFLALAEELHFGKAAEKLYTSQPPLSRTISELEDELQVKLFERSSRRVELTKQGIFLRDEAKKLFVHIEQIKLRLNQIGRGQTGIVKIGYVGSAMHCVLPAILVELKNAFDISIILNELKEPEQIEAVKDGTIDIGFIRSDPGESKRIQCLKIFEETFSVALSPSRAALVNQQDDLAMLADQPFISLSYDCAPKLCDDICEICKQAGFLPRIAHETSQVNSIVRLVESGMGYSIVPSSVQTAYSVDVKFIELSRFDIKAQLFMIAKEDMDALTANCARLIKEFCMLELNSAHLLYRS